MRIILLFLAVITIFWLVKRLFFNPDSSHMRSKSEGEELVQCAQCEIHLPKSNAIEVDGAHYCCKEHAKQR